MLWEDDAMRTQTQVCMAAAVAIAAALFVAADRDRNATAQEAAIQNRAGRPAADQSARSMPKFRASALIGMNVRGTSDDDDIGEIKDIAIGQDGTVAYVAVSFGGFLGLGDKLFAVPFEAVEFVREDPDDPDDDDHFARIAVTEEQLRSRKGFNEENWPEQADEGFLQASRTRQVERPVPRRTDRDATR